MKQKPLLSFWQIWNVSFGFLGIQVGYSLQSTNTSRILASLGADPGELPLFWMVAPIAGLVVQPIIGMYSDRTWNKMGRRIPYIFCGSILATFAMLLMPNSEIVIHFMPPLLFGVCMLLFMDTSFNITMQPFRSLVSDMVNDKQRNIGYYIQSLLTSLGAIIGSILPFIITFAGIRNIPIDGERIAPSVIWSFYIGAGILLPAILWTCFRVKEYSPNVLKEYTPIEDRETESKKPMEIIRNIPKVMYQLAVVQFFSWFALFLMWVYTTNAIAQNVWGTTDPLSAAFNEAGNWTGVLNATYAICATLFSLLMVRIANTYGRKKIYAIALAIGGISLMSIFFFTNQYLLLLSMVGIGIAWACILSIPYAILSARMPHQHTGMLMGIFNMTITIPQILAGLTGGILYNYIAEGNSATMLLIAGCSMLLSSLAVRLVNDSK